MRAHQTTYSSIWNFLPGINSVQDSALHRWTAHVLRGLNCLLTFLACTINTGAEGGQPRARSTPAEANIKVAKDARQEHAAVWRILVLLYTSTCMEKARPRGQAQAQFLFHRRG